MQSYPTERKQSTKINQAYCSWKEMLFDVPPKIHTYICVSALFLLIKNIGFASYADANTIFNAGGNTMRSYFSSKNYLNILKWFPDNQIENNVHKCHLIVEIEIGEFSIKSRSS